MRCIIFRFLLCFCSVAVTYARTEEEIRTWFMSLGLECNKDYAISAEEMADLHAHKMPTTENPKCLLACVFKKSSWMNDKGMFDLDTAKAFVEKEHVGIQEKIDNSIKLFEDCKSVNDETVSDGEKGCQRAALLMKCLSEKAPKMGFNLMM